MSKQIDVIYGSQMGDEGKGGFALHYAHEGYFIVARYNGGANAGHTFDFLGQEVNTHQVPSGIACPGVLNLITNCSLVDPAALQEEMAEITNKGIEINPKNLGISRDASLVMPHHIMLDSMREIGSGRQGTTKRGIAYAASEKFGRSGIFMHQLETNPGEVKEKIIKGIQDANVLLECIGEEARVMKKDPKEAYQKWLKAAHDTLPFMIDTVEIVHKTLQKGDRILAEGAQSIGLDIDHGIRQENTSSLTGVAGAQQSLGVGPDYIDRKSAVAKAWKSRVGGTPGSFPTYIDNRDLAERLRGKPGEPDYEAGKSTGRKRDIGWLDMTDLRVAKRVNGMDELLLSKLDCVPLAGDTVKIATHYVDENGKEITHRPNHVELLKGLTPAYIELPTWSENIQGMTKYDDLPLDAKRFIETVEELVEAPITIIGTGPGAGQQIDRRNKKLVSA